jgi:hypothetical protein
MKTLSGMLLYVSVQEPVAAYVKPGLPAKPKEYKASVVITEKSVIKEYQKFAKSLDTLVSVKEVETSEFESIYKVPPPEDAGEEVWVVTLRKSTEQGKTGKPLLDIHRPRVYEQVGNTRVDITHTKLVGNGSYGKLAIDVFIKQTGTGSISLKSVLVTDLVEYERKESTAQANDGSEFDDDSSSASSTSSTSTPAKSAVKPAAKPAVKAKAKVEDDFEDSDLPF